MADHSKIEWTEATWNPTVGCDIVSPGCKNCYAMRDAYRKGFNPKVPRYHGLTKMTKGGPVWTGGVRTVPELLDAPLHWKKPRRIFVDSMSDLFHEDLPFRFIAAVFGVMAMAHWHTYQVLTKRPARALEFFRWLGISVGRGDGPPMALVCDSYYGCLIQAGHHGVRVTTLDRPPATWPLPNVWLGTSVERQPEADERIPLLLQTPAAVRWISGEPLLGPVSLEAHLEAFVRHKSDGGKGYRAGRLIEPGLDWVVVGGESGPGARPFDISWARSLRDQCRAAGVPYFLKQLGAFVVGDANDPRNPGLEGDTQMISDGRDGALAHFRFKDRKGGDPKEWPEDLRIREYPR